MRQLLFGKLVPPVNPVHHLQRPIRLHLVAALIQKLHECGGFVREPDPHEGVERKGRIANPGVAVIPVARAAHALGQAASRRRDDRAGGLKGEQLQHQRGAMHHLAPAALDRCTCQIQRRQ